MAKERVLIDADKLKHLYCVEMKSLWEISVIFDCSRRTVSKKIERYGIPERPPSYRPKRAGGPEFRRKVSEGCPKGPAHHRWKGGVTPEHLKVRYSVEYALWREQVFKRDDWTCQRCGKRGGDIEADHIQRFADHPELRMELSNGQTLCKVCHKAKTIAENKALSS